MFGKDYAATIEPIGMKWPIKKNKIYNVYFNCILLIQ